MRETSYLPRFPLTALVGRERESQEIALLLRRRDVRLLTLTGTGGVGKTRLALSILAAVSPIFSNGVCAVSLASFDHPDLILPALARELGVRGELEQPLFETLRAFLQTKHLLIFLDNFEQVIAGAPVLVDLLMDCPHAKILVTSREALRVRGEHVFRIAPLPLPDRRYASDLHALSHNGAFSLFVQRCQARDSSFQVTQENAPVIAEICMRLDGLPLALELAAARVKLLSLQTLLGRLDRALPMLTQGDRDLPIRQQTLRNTLAWSYNLLTSEEQRLFCSLSVFEGGCTLEAVESVYGEAGTLEAMASLLEKNLLQRGDLQQRGEIRFFLLATIREYGKECLEASGESPRARRAHADYYLALAEKAEPHLTGAEGLVWLDRLQQEYDNLRTALHWWTGSGEQGIALRFGNALRQFWIMRGHGREGYRLMKTMLAGSSHNVDSVHARALLTTGMLAQFDHEYDQRIVFCEESLQLSRRLGDRQGIARALNELGCAAHSRGKQREARALHEESLALYREINDCFGIAETMLFLAHALYSLIENQRARMLAEESLRRFRSLDHRWGLAKTLSLLAFIAGYFQEHSKAIALAEESLQIFRELDDQWGIAIQLHYVAELASRQNDHERALQCAQDSLAVSRNVGNREAIARALYLLARISERKQQDTTVSSLLEQSLALYQELGNQEGMAFVFNALSFSAFRRGVYKTAQAFCEQSLALLVERDNRPALIENLILLSHIVAAQGHVTWATRLLGASDALREAIGREPTTQINAYRRITAMASTTPGERHFSASWKEGRAMTPQQVIALQDRSAQPGAVVRREVPLPPFPTHLTAREMEVLSLMTTGLTNPQIADQLVISPVTVNSHVRSIYRKLNVSSRSAATRFALEQRLI